MLLFSLSLSLSILLFVFVFVFVVVFLLDFGFFCVMFFFVGIYVGLFHCRNYFITNLRKFITVNIIESVNGNSVNVTKYLIIMISVIIGVFGGGGGGWYIFLKTLILPWLVAFTMNLFMNYFKFRHQKLSQKINNKHARTATVNCRGWKILQPL